MLASVTVADFAPTSEVSVQLMLNGTAVTAAGTTAPVGVVMFTSEDDKA